MELSLFTLMILVPPLLLIEGFFSGSEIALLSADRFKLKQKAESGGRGAKLALALATHPERVLSTTLVMTSLCVIGISTLTTLLLHQLEVPHSEAWAVLCASPLVVIFGELLPKTLYQRYCLVLAPYCSYAVTAAYYLFFPVTRLVSIYTSRVSRLIAPIEEILSGRKRTTRDELLSMLSYGKRESEIKSSERKMIRRILDFKHSEAKHALIPLVKIEAIEVASTVREALERFEQHRHSRMPIYAERIDNIIGVLEVSDLFSATDLSQSVRGFVSSAHYVAETQALDDLLIEMRQEDQELVVVVDEHGGAVGLLTFEDIVEEIVGEIADEYDSDVTQYRQISDTSWQVQGRIEIDLLNEKLKLDLPSGDYETLSGFLLQQFGRIPEIHDELYFDTSAGTLRFSIQRATERRIEAVQIDRIAPKKE